MIKPGVSKNQMFARGLETVVALETMCSGFLKLFHDGSFLNLP